MAINSVVLVGRLGKDIELKKTASDISFCNFSVAVDRGYKQGDERVTDWIDCTAWRSTAEFLAKFFHKGSMVGVTGSLEVRKWETDDGQKRSVTYVSVQNVSFVEGKKDGQNSAEPTSAFSEDTTGGELPF